MNKKAVSMVLVAVIVIVVVVVVGVAAYWALTSTGGENGGNGGNGGGEDVYTVENATSLSFKVNATIGGVNELYAFTAKNLGTSDIQLRVDETDAEGAAFIYVYNQTAQTAWANVEGAWMDLGDFTAYWSGDYSGLVGHTAFDCYQTELAANWSGTGDHDYTSGEDTFHIFDIAINPSLDDSLFAYS